MEDQLLYSEDGKTVIGVSDRNISSVTVPESVTTIKSGAFRNCSNLVSIEIPESVTTIESGAFILCGKLQSIVIPNNITRIEKDTFWYCKKLMSIEIPSSVMSIEDGAFWGCSNLVSIEIPERVIKIGARAFRDCYNLKSIEIPSSVKSIGDSSFWGCESLASIEIPSSVKSIGDYAFFGCSGITSMKIPDSVIHIGHYTLRGCNLSRVYLSPSTKYEKDSFDEKTEIINMRVFISYSYDSKDHEKWVEKLAEDLTAAGIYVILDKWDLRPGSHMPNFMERGIGESDKVICILTPIYKEKAQKLKHGVGYEYSVMSAEIFDGMPREKFVPVLRSGDFKDANPFSGAFVLDMRDDKEYDDNLKKLIGYIYEIPRRPPLGRRS